MTPLKISVAKLIKIIISIVVIAAIALGAATIVRNDKITTSSKDVSEKQEMELLKAKYDSGFQTVATSGDFSLLSDFSTAEIAILNNKTNNIWYSNPQDRANDEKAKIKTRLSSQLIVQVEKVDGGNITTVDSYMGSVYKKGMSCELIDNGIRFEFRFPEQGLIIPIEYTLVDGALTASVITDGISEMYPDEYRLVSIGILPFLGAGGFSDEGYLFVPDGSGALIDFNNGKVDSAAYAQPVYGSNLLMNAASRFDDIKTETSIYMPVFGSKVNGTACFGIITSGDAESVINASVSGITSSYNQVYPSFRYREVFITTIDQNGVHEFKQYGEPNLNGIDFSVTYNFLEGDKANYSAMANLYREYLIDEGLLTKKANKNDAIVLEMYGAVTTTKEILGIETKSVTAMTDYSQISDISENLIKNGAENFSMLYRGWNDGGLRSKITTKASGEKVLGGKKALSTLIKNSNENGINIYFDSDFMNLYVNGNGYTHYSDTALLATQDLAKQMHMRNSSRIFNEDNVWYLLSPSAITEAFSKFSNNVRKMGINSVAEMSFGESLYSDFNEDDVYTRSRTQQVVCSSLKDMNKQVENLAVSGGNAYTVPYVTTVFNAPTTETGFDMADRSIPFYSMVFHGYVQMTSDSLNQASDYNQAVLKALESGYACKYTLFMEDSTLLYGTEYNDLFNSSYSDWESVLLEQYHSFEKIYEKIGNLTIVNHSEVADGVFITEYEDGTCITVNYNDTDTVIDNLNVPEMGYVVFTKGE